MRDSSSSHRVVWYFQRTRMVMDWGTYGRHLIARWRQVDRFIRMLSLLRQQASDVEGGGNR